MSQINYPASSPYALTPQTSWYLANYVSRRIAKSGDDKTLTITKKYQYRPDTLSNDLYGTPAYWWIFAVRNRDVIQDPVWDLEIGVTIITPSLATLQKALGT